MIIGVGGFLGSLLCYFVLKARDLRPKVHMLNHNHSSIKGQQRDFQFRATLFSRLSISRMSVFKFNLS